MNRGKRVFDLMANKRQNLSHQKARGATKEKKEERKRHRSGKKDRKKKSGDCDEEIRP